MMEISQRKEQFSRAYVHAVAAVAGFAHYSPSVDDDSIDIGFAQRGGGGTTRAPHLEAQIKCSAQGLVSEDIKFPLKKKTTTICAPRMSWCREF
jgi:hypothetical protein